MSEKKLQKGIKVRPHINVNVALAKWLRETAKEVLKANESELTSFGDSGGLGVYLDLVITIRPYPQAKELSEEEFHERFTKT